MYLKQLSVDFIKIDGSFIRRLNENRDDQLFVRAMCEVARGLHIKTIAESVENGETIVILKKIGVDYAQGFYLGRPAPVFGLKT
jgi:EAL domain-containing protein (putative c-di-GMP-specific phosphodiesterase class I)